MKPAYCSVVHFNDIDIIEYNLRYYYNIGIRDFYLLLHNPTIEIENLILDTLNKMVEKELSNYQITISRNDKHYHDTDMMQLIGQARADECDWIIGTDADELLLLRDCRTIQDLLCRFDNPQETAFLFEWYEYPITRELNSGIDNPFTELKYRNIDPQIQYKAIGIFDEKMKYLPGIHDIINTKNRYLVDPLMACYVHFPIRNRNQFVTKMQIQYKNWMERYKSFPLQKEIESDSEFLNKFFETKIVRDTTNLIYNPIPKEFFEI